MDSVVINIVNPDLEASMGDMLGNVAKVVLTIRNADLEVDAISATETTTVEVIMNRYIVGKSAYEIALGNGFEGTQEEWLASLVGPLGMNSLLSGEKRSSRDAGSLWDMSLTDDYIYVCVRGGEAGQAIWKKFILFTS